jgi:hypothetical protein
LNDFVRANTDVFAEPRGDIGGKTLTGYSIRGNLAQELPEGYTEPPAHVGGRTDN